jgi:NADPH:quinone reductase-like Zn-dependent oxidoreductase
MHAWHLIESPGDYEFGEVPDPECGPTDVRVAVKASGLNHIDHWQRRGLPKPKSFPHVTGSDGAGVIESVGSEVTNWKPGDEVVINTAITSFAAIEELGIDSVLDKSMQLMGEHRWGAHGELVVVPAHNLAKRPANRSWEECAAYPVALTTAWRMLRRVRLEPGERVLITGIGGGVATAAMMLAIDMGAVVFTTSRDALKRERSVELGAADSFDSAGPYPITVDVIVDSIGPATWDASFRCLRPGGRYVTCGGTSGQKVEVTLPKLFFRQHEIIGSTLGSQQEFEYVTERMAAGLPVVIDGVFDLADYPKAVERLQQGDQLGKLILRH